MKGNQHNVEPDEDLAAAILGGNHESFRVLVIRHDALVRRVVGRCVADPMIVEDAIQETWCQSFKNLRDLVNPASLPAWLTKIATRCAWEQQRKLVRCQVIFDSPVLFEELV